jgi:hypothetical protein
MKKRLTRILLLLYAATLLASGQARLGQPPLNCDRGCLNALALALSPGFRRKPSRSNRTLRDHWSGGSTTSIWPALDFLRRLRSTLPT